MQPRLKRSRGRIPLSPAEMNVAPALPPESLPLDLEHARQFQIKVHSFRITKLAQEDGPPKPRCPWRQNEHKVMNTFTFFRQERADGGIRSGIDINGATVLEAFANGKPAYDPTLLWYVDVRCTGKNVPDDPEGARQWLLQQEKIVREALDQLAEDLRAGLDIESWPLHRDVPGAPKGARMTVVCSAMRRIDALRIAQILRGIGEKWKTFIISLKAVHPISS